MQKKEVISTHSAVCDSCHKEWKYKVLCPICWNETLEKLNDNNWKCLKCGNDLWVEQGADDKVRKIICPHCHVIYTVM